jgi:hypothetical protein
MQSFESFFYPSKFLLDLTNRQQAEVKAGFLLEVDGQLLTVQPKIFEGPSIAQPHIGVDDLLHGSRHWPTRTVRRVPPSTAAPTFGVGGMGGDRAGRVIAGKRYPLTQGVWRRRVPYVSVPVWQYRCPSTILGKPLVSPEFAGTGAASKPILPGGWSR